MHISVKFCTVVIRKLSENKINYRYAKLNRHKICKFGAKYSNSVRNLRNWKIFVMLHDIVRREWCKIMHRGTPWPYKIYKLLCRV